MLRYRWILFLYILLPLSAHAVPTHDATSTPVTVNGSGTLSRSHTVSGGCTNPFLTVKIGWFSGSGTSTISSVTYNSVALTEVDTVSDGSNNSNVSMWELINPATGSSHDATVTFGVAPNEITLIVSSYCGVHQTTPLGTAATGVDVTSTATVTVASAADELVTDAVFLWGPNGSLTVDGSQTQRGNINDPSTEKWAGGSDKAGAASVVMSWTLTGDFIVWEQIGVSIKPAAGGGGGGQRPIAPIIFGWMQPHEAFAGAPDPPIIPCPSQAYAHGKHVCPAHRVPAAKNKVRMALDRTAGLDADAVITFSIEISPDGHTWTPFVSGVTRGGTILDSHGATLPANTVVAILPPNVPGTYRLRTTIEVSGEVESVTTKETVTYD
jgi:hypothetical protein